ncbi:uncharacterized protein K02A2.6-like [Nasonia vitripennis]|uniref:RNA-directed DNA polymerase n=1 Tax=Nasonia vitripennis TaxID=7425 RepID=A0A7M7T7K4_NASVI|nr:uncharacterized protein K02A2.6-like [Nasonia vitripennis]
MKALARSYFWWPKLDHEIENIVKSCKLCLEVAENPPKSTLHVSEWPEEPNQRIHADFCGPVNGFMYLIIIDAHSKWIDIKEMSDITAKNTIGAFKEYFSVWGLPNALVMDNGPTFTSEASKEFLDNNNVKHNRTAPYHPASNGAAENAVRSFKNKFKKLCKDKLSRQDALLRYLLYYRSTPHSTTGVSPDELQIGKKLRTRLSAISSVACENVERSQERQCRNFKGNRNIEFKKNNVVMAKDYAVDKWRVAEVVDKLGPVTYSVSTNDNRTWKRHTDQLRPYENPMYAQSNVATDNVNSGFLIPNSFCKEPSIISNSNFVKHQSFGIAKEATASQSEPMSTETVNINEQPNATIASTGLSQNVRRSTRNRRAPERLNL